MHFEFIIPFEGSLKNITSDCHFKFATKQLNSQSQKLDKNIKPHVDRNLVANALWYKYGRQLQHVKQKRWQCRFNVMAVPPYLGRICSKTEKL